jgi:16S rRNA processing protein RimM
VVGKPHGLDGSFYVAEARPPLLERGMTVIVAGAPREIVRRSGTEERPLVRLAGTDDRTAAEALRGQELLVPRSAAPQLEEDEYWPEQLVGCTVRDGAVEVGVVEELLAYPSCELLSVQRAGAEPLLVPLVRDAIRSIDVDGREIQVSLEFLGE